MSKDIAIHLSNVGKMYRIFSSRGDNLIDALGLARLMPWRPVSYREFWAVRGIDIELEAGRRIGVIGRNGAGKTTLLKLICGNLPQTEGKIKVQGDIQALLSIGAGFHPEFTGYENIRAALTYQGMNKDQVEDCIHEIADFTELGQFLEQPFKNYSAGMQARLSFATATAIQPEILIVDEVLGAGDAYFFSKSTERMSNLVNGGASVLLVSHALDQITRFCDEAIWLERGRIIQRGSALEIVKAYEEFIHVLNDRRLRAKNYKRLSSQYNPDSYDIYSDNLVVRIVVRGNPGDSCDVAEVRLLKNNELEDSLHVGDTQDVNTFQSSYVVLDDNNCWSKPGMDESGFYRSITIPYQRDEKKKWQQDKRRKARKKSVQVMGDDPKENLLAGGSVVFYLYAFFQEGEYAVEIDYRYSGWGDLVLEIHKNGRLMRQMDLPKDVNGWQSQHISLEFLKQETTERLLADRVGDSDTQVETIAPLPIPTQEATGEKQIVSSEHLEEKHMKEQIRQTEMAPLIRKVKPKWHRWPGENSIMVEDVHLVDENNQESGLFRANEPMSVRIILRAQEGGKFPVIPTAVFFRMDGIMISQMIAEPVEFELKKDELFEARLDMGPLNLGNGNYVISIGIYRTLDISDVEKPVIYDLIDRSFEFEVFGKPALLTELFHHPGNWKYSRLSEQK